MSFLNRDKRKEVASDITSQAAAQVANSAMAFKRSAVRSRLSPPN